MNSDDQPVVETKISENTDQPPSGRRSGGGTILFRILARLWHRLTGRRARRSDGKRKASSDDLYPLW